MRNVWAVVVLVGLGLTSITVADVFHVLDPALLGYISATVVPTVAVLLGWQQVHQQVSQVDTKVNGHLAQLTAAKTITDVPTLPAESGPDAGGTGGS